MRKGREEHSGPIVVVQWIEVEWGKDARGAEAATRRNRLPNALPLPELVLRPESRIVVQRLYFNGNVDFELRAREVDQYPEVSLGSLPRVDLEMMEPNLLLNPQMTFTDIHWPQLSVVAGEWSCLVWNERVKGYEDQWRYKQTTLNIAHLAQFSPTIFLDQPPATERSDLRALY